MDYSVNRERASDVACHVNRFHKTLSPLCSRKYRTSTCLFNSQSSVCVYVCFSFKRNDVDFFPLSISRYSPLHIIDSTYRLLYMLFSPYRQENNSKMGKTLHEICSLGSRTGLRGFRVHANKSHAFPKETCCKRIYNHNSRRQDARGRHLKIKMHE